nr:MAG TPA: hypothetical protein [Bacteriophage sp.]
MFWLGVDKLQKGSRLWVSLSLAILFYYKYTSPKPKQENSIKMVLK